MLLSHDQHPDNLDTAGRALVGSAPRVLTTPLDAGRLGGAAVGMEPWSEIVLDAPHGRSRRVTAVPARHGPDGTEHLTGPVTGFVIGADRWPTVYVSGDNASLGRVAEIAGRCPAIDVAVLFAGAARTPLLGEANLTLTSDETATVARLLGAADVVVVHCDGWAHFTEGPAEVVAAFERAGLLDRLRRIVPGVWNRMPSAPACDAAASWS